jgi:lysophospholipase L1-like esterase
MVKDTDYGSNTPQYQINRLYDSKLADKAGHRLPADYASMSFSANGQWMVISEPNIAMLRVNLQTFEVTPFAPGFNYTIGLNPLPQTAISNDGRYATVASKDFGRFALYDLDTCVSVPDTISGPVSCQSRDLQSYMGQQIPGYTNASNIRFISDDTLSLYATSAQGSTRTTAKYVLANTSGIIHQQDYLALGDSYISGEGAFNYQEDTDTVDNKCHVSKISYPLLAGHDLNYNSYHSVACSGAHTTDITDTSNGYKGQTTYKKTRKELEQNGEISQILTNFSQGYIDQLDFVSQYQPKVITVSIGGNDIGFSSIVRKCVVSPDACYNTYEDRLELVRQTNNKIPTLVDTYTKIKNAAAPDTRIYVVGYPQIAKPGGDCGANVHLDAQEIDFSRMLVDYLDSVIKVAADKAGVKYVDVQDALYGHRLCEAGRGSLAMNGLTLGKDSPVNTFGPLGNESYHPNNMGHQLLENKLLAATHNLTDSMPTPNTFAVPPAENGLEILNATLSGRAINVASFDDSIADNLVYKQAWWNISVEGVKYALKPLASGFRAVLQSEPVGLGTFTTDSTGNLSAQVQVPSNVPAGFHTLHIYGTNVAGDPIDIYKLIYVASSQSDIDGDGVADSNQACVGISAIGQDYDQDGIDDACDGNIGEAPPPPPAPVIPDPEPQQPTPNPEPSAPSQDSPPADIQPTENPQASSQTDSSPTTDDIQVVDSPSDNSLDRSVLVLALSQNPSTQQVNSSINQSVDTTHSPEFAVDQSSEIQTDNSKVLASNIESVSPAPQKPTQQISHYGWLEWAGLVLAALLIIFTLIKLPL